MSNKGYVNPQLLWEPAELHARLNDPKLCLIDCRAGEEYSQGHTPGAQLFDLFGISLSDTDPAPLKSYRKRNPMQKILGGPVISLPLASPLSALPIPSLR
jgi:rhodanese-related sulfurtransferase